MDSIIPFLIFSLCSVRGEPLPDAVQRRSDKGVYASEYTRDYEPMTFAAIPLHQPIPVLHILSPVPPRAPARPAQSAQRPVYALPPQQFDAYRYGRPYRYAQPVASSQPYAASQTYAVSQPYAASQTYAVSQPYAASQPYGPYVMYASDEAGETAPTVLYARPNPDGGYTYRRRPTKKRNNKRPANEPVLIRVHKYRIIRDR